MKKLFASALKKLASKKQYLDEDHFSLNLLVYYFCKKLYKPLLFSFAFLVGGKFFILSQFENPLDKNSPKESANFLIQASANAEKRLALKLKEDERGAAYIECMEDKNAEFPCEKLFETMISFAKENHYPKFKTLRLAELKNPRSFTRLQDDYYEALVSSLPEYKD